MAIGQIVSVEIYEILRVFLFLILFFMFLVNLKARAPSDEKVISYRGPAKKTRCTRHLASKFEIITGQFWYLLAKILIIKIVIKSHSLLY